MRGSLSKKYSSLPFFTGALEPWLLMRFPFSACQNCVEEEEKEGGREGGGKCPWGVRAVVGVPTHSRPPNAPGQESIMTPARRKIQVSERICTRTSECNLVEFTCGPQIV